MAERTRPDAPLADGMFLAGGGALVASAFLYWVSRGPGSGLRGHTLVDAIMDLGKHVPALSRGRLTIVWYVVPALGAASWVAFGLAGRRSRAARIIAIAALVVTLLVDGAFRQLVGMRRLGLGPKVALVGAVLLVVASWLPGRMRQNDAAGRR